MGTYDEPALIAGCEGAGYDSAASSGRGHALAVFDRAKVAAKAVDDVLPTPEVSIRKLQNLVGNLYKGTTNPNRAGHGTTMDAIRNEIATGCLRGSAQEAGASYLLNLRDLRVVGKDVPDQVRAAVRAGG